MKYARTDRGLVGLASLDIGKGISLELLVYA